MSFWDGVVTVVGWIWIAIVAIIFFTAILAVGAFLGLVLVFFGWMFLSFLG